MTLSATALADVVDTWLPSPQLRTVDRATWHATVDGLTHPESTWSVSLASHGSPLASGRTWIRTRISAAPMLLHADRRDQKLTGCTDRRATIFSNMSLALAPGVTKGKTDNPQLP